MRGGRWTGDQMTTLLRRPVCGAAGASMIVALLLAWAGVQGGDHTGSEVWTVASPLCVVVAACALTTAVTGGQIGLFRPDVSILGATDILSVATTLTLAWLLIYDLPAHASGQPALILALVSAAAAAFAAADYRPLRGAAMFPRVDQRSRSQRPEHHAEASRSAS